MMACVNIGDFMKYLLRLVCFGSGMMIALFDSAYCMDKSGDSKISQIRERLAAWKIDQQNAWNEEEKRWHIPEIYNFLAWHSLHIRVDQKAHRNLVFKVEPEVSSQESREEFFVLYGDEGAEFYNRIGGCKSYFMLYLYQRGVLYFPKINGKPVIYPLCKVTQSEIHELFEEFEELLDMFRDDMLRDIPTYRDMYQRNGSENRYKFLNWLAQDNQYIQDSANSRDIRDDMTSKWEAYCSLFARYRSGWATPKSKLFEIKEKK